jgi:hypothetical protein
MAQPVSKSEAAKQGWETRRQSLLSLDTLVCRRCGLIKAIAHFLYRPLLGPSRTCRECYRTMQSKASAVYARRAYHTNENGRRDKHKEAERLRQTGISRAERSKKYIRTHPMKYAAHKIYSVAVRSGKLLRQSCQVCGDPQRKAHGHHDDYTKPLDVIWLCSEHHFERHRLMNRRIESDEWPKHWPVELRPSWLKP